MKNTKKVLALTLAAAMGLSAVPTLSCSAAGRTELEKCISRIHMKNRLHLILS